MNTALVPVNENRHVERNHILPAMTLHDAVERYNDLVSFTKEIMTKGKDYGEIPGTDKPTLLKPGAEKLATFFGLIARFEIGEKIQDWTGAEHGGEQFFYYMVKCRLFRDERCMGEGDGSCNSWESRYRYRWIADHDLPFGTDKSKCRRRGGKVSEFTFSVDRAETAGKYGKPSEYWQAFKDAIGNSTAKKIQKRTKDGKVFDAWEIDRTFYRVPNSDIADAVNTVLKMACKRALVAAVLIATNASEYFTQDLDDLEVIDAEFIESPTAPPPVKQEQHHQAKSSNGQPDKLSSKTGEPFDSKLRILAERWQKAGYCSAAEVFVKLGEWAYSQGVSAPPKEWPEELAIRIKPVLEAMLAEFKKPAPGALLHTIGDLCTRLNWSDDYRDEYFANAFNIQPGELPNEYRAQAIVLELQQQLREAKKGQTESSEPQEEDEVFF